MIEDQEWIPLTYELLVRMDSGEFDDNQYWILTKNRKNIYIGSYLWKQGYQPHGFDTLDAGRYNANEISHVMPFKKPKPPGETL